MEKKLVYDIHDRPSFGKMIIFALQQLLAIMAATIAVPAIVGNGMSYSAALFGAGVGTIVYQLFTKFRSPVFLGSSFAFIGSMSAAFAGAASASLGYLGIILGAAFAGLIYVVISLVVKLVGINWIDKITIESVMPSNHLILCRPLLLLPAIFPSVRVFSNESALCIRWPKYRSFSFNISPSNEHPGLISFRMDWLDLFAVQGTLKSLLQHHSSKVSILWCSVSFMVKLSHPYITIGKTIVLTRQTFVSKLMSAF